MALTIKVNHRRAERWRSVARYLGFPKLPPGSMRWRKRS